MKRLFLTSLALFSLALNPVFAQEAAKPEANLPSRMETLELKDGDSIVFLGDSITHQCLYTQYVEDYFYTRFPQLRLKIHNSGVGGAKAWDALQRFDQDVAAYHPKYVTILLGMNDGTYRPYDDATFQTYRNDMTEILDRLKAIDAQAIPMTPTMYDSRAKRLYGRPGTPEESVEMYNSVMAYYGTWLREKSNERGLGFVDMWSPLNNITLEEREKDPAFTLIRDAVHPGPDGQVVMATSIINDLELPKIVSAIRISVNSNGKWNAKAKNGKLDHLSSTDQGLSFSFTAKSLPWVLPEDAQLGAKLTHLGHRYSRESLHVSGLAPGKYTLSIDGTDVGTYPSQRFADGIELESNSKTPQYQQALQVAQLNKKRNAGPVMALRNEWRAFQQYARVKRASEQAPENEKLKAQVTKLEASIKGIEDRVAQHQADAKKIEDEIFEINQPKTHKYVITAAK